MENDNAVAGDITLDTLQDAYASDAQPKQEYSAALEQIFAPQRKPQLGDIIIHNYGALVYIGTIERFCTHNPDMVEGPVLVVGGDDARFYECQVAHYFPLSKCKVVSKPPVMPFDDEAVPEANIPAMTGVDTLLDIPEPLGGALEPSEESKQALRSLADTATKLGAPLVLGSAPDEEPF